MSLRGYVGGRVRGAGATATPDAHLGSWVREATRANGRALPAAVRRSMEQRFRTGLGAVRIHTGPAAAAVADRLGARAVTAGRHILFADREYAPDTSAGRWLLAHELAHVLQQQQGGSAFDGPTGVGPADDRFEREADQAADLVCAGRQLPPLTPDPSGLARRVVRPDVSSATITLVRGPGVQTQAPSLLNQQNAAFTCGTHDAAGNITTACITANASVVVNGDAGDSLAGWRFGFVQVEWIETNWGYYRGQVNNHGSAFLQRGRAPARPTQACRDTSDNTGVQYFYDPMFITPPFPAGAAAFPQTIRVNGWNDTPGDFYPLQVFNNKTRQLNFLREAQFEFHFLTVFSALSPANRVTHLAHLFWNLHWQSRFQPASFVDRTNLVTPADVANAALPWTVTPIAGGNAFNTSRTFLGTPTGTTARDRAMIALLDPATFTSQSCNAMAAQASPLPAGFVGPSLLPQRESNVWDNFNLDR